jgi:hypothetical protein
MIEDAISSTALRQTARFFDIPIVSLGLRWSRCFAVDGLAKLSIFAYSLFEDSGST